MFAQQAATLSSPINQIWLESSMCEESEKIEEQCETILTFKIEGA